MLYNNQNRDAVSVNESNESTNICAHCGEAIPDGQGVEVEGALYCERCFDCLFTTCDECGEVIPIDDAIQFDGRTYCESCECECLIWCEHCRNYEYHDNARQVQTDHRSFEWWCDTCVRRYATQCDDCYDVFSDDYFNDEGIRDAHSNYICHRCRENYYYCEECGEYYHYDEYDTDAEMCNDCAEKRGHYLIKSYHNAPRLYFYGNAPHGAQWRGIGFELEIDRDSRDADDERATVDALEAIAGGHLFYERDGSLDYGFEIISHPHTLAEFERLPIAEILDACKKNGYTSHDNGRCGLHFHISRAMFGATEEKQARAIAKLLRFFDTHYSDILKVSRRTREGAERWAARYCCESIDEAREYASGKKCAGRYCAVNLTNRATVEVRIMRGTLNPSTFEACADFVTRLAINSKKISWKRVDDAGAWLEGMKPATLEYIKRREAFAGVV